MLQIFYLLNYRPLALIQFLYHFIERIFYRPGITKQFQFIFSRFQFIFFEGRFLQFIKQKFIVIVFFIKGRFSKLKIVKLLVGGTPLAINILVTL